MEYNRTFKYALPNNCPESFINNKHLDIGDYGITYYRISKEFPPSGEDFLPQFFQATFCDRVDRMNKENDHSGVCQMASASILKTKDDAIRLVKKFRRLGKYIFCGVINESDGLILVSPSRDFPSHCSFFVYSGVNESRIFETGVYL